MEAKVSNSAFQLNIEDESFFHDLREKEFKRLDSSGHHIYFDYTGGNLYPKSLIEKHTEMLLEGTFGNPHSINPTSARATELVAAARAKVLSYFNATEDYICVFTHNASGALKIVGESYPFNADSHYVILSDNHNSVNGIREFCNHKNGHTHYVSIRPEDLRIDDHLLKSTLEAHADSNNNLFAFPAQSNVSGVKHDLNWVKHAQDKGYDVLLDAAAFVPTSKLDLKEVQPEFVSVSFYKIFGYPTGLGCLMIKKSVFDKLQKPWFAGGTVDVVSIAYPFHTLEEGHERFEDGTLNYLNIPTLKLGLEFIESIGIERIQRRVENLTAYLLDTLNQLKHKNGEPVVHILGPQNTESRGGTIIMTFNNKDGITIPFDDIEQAAVKKNISLRTGCFCNPGLDEINSKITSEELEDFYKSKDFEVHYKEMIHLNDKMRGATRISVGMATTESDLIALIDFIKEYFDCE